MKHFTEGNIFSCSSLLSVQVHSANGSARLLAVLAGRSSSDEGLREDLRDDYSVLKICNILPEAQKWIFPFLSGDGCHSCAKETALVIRAWGKSVLRSFPSGQLLIAEQGGLQHSARLTQADQVFSS